MTTLCCGGADGPLWWAADHRRRSDIIHNNHLPFLLRFWVRVAGVRRGCWEWRGATDPDGYGVLRYQRSRMRAHRVSWQLANGPVPKGLHVLHSCDNPPCVNPDHLFLGTHQDNVRDRDQKKRGKVPIRRAGRWTGEVRRVS